MANIEEKPAICGIGPGGCAIIATLRDGRLVQTKSDEGNPYGAICVRGLAAPDIVYSPDRLTSPLIRTGEKGKGEFRRASWEEALDITARSMQRIKSGYGGEAMMYHYGRGAFEQSSMEFSNRWLYAFGSPNVTGVSSLCAVASNILAPVLTLGLKGWNLLPDIENSKTIVVWGGNPITDSPPLMLPRIIKAQKRGATVIAIDHMRSDIAQRAHRWLAVRSGTDGALALGVLRVIVNENRYDREFVEKWTVGFGELKEYVQEFTPEKVERITRVPASAVVMLARAISGADPASLVMHTGLEYTNSGVQNIRAVLILWALTGNLDVPGGLLISLPSRLPIDTAGIRAPQHVPRIGAGEYPLFVELVRNAQYMEMPKAVLQGDPYPIKGILINGASTLVNYPQPGILEEAYQRLDFMAVIDIFMTKDALFADVVLPATTPFEKSSYQRYEDYVRLRERIIEPVGASRNDALILAALAQRLGYGGIFPQTEEEILRTAFAKKPELLKELRSNPTGLKLDLPPFRSKKWEVCLLRPDGRPGFRTLSGKMEIVSTLLANHGYDAIPVYKEPIESPLADPELAQKYPLVLNTGARMVHTYRSQHLNIPSLVKLQKKPLVLIHPADAGSRGIKDGDKVILRTRRGRAEAWANVSEKVRPGGVEVNAGGGNPIQVEAWRNFNVNVLTDFFNRDPISGFPVLKALLCEVEKA